MPVSILVDDCRRLHVGGCFPWGTNCFEGVVFVWVLMSRVTCTAATMPDPCCLRYCFFNTIGQNTNGENTIGQTIKNIQLVQIYRYFGDQHHDRVAAEPRNDAQRGAAAASGGSQPIDVEPSVDEFDF